MFLLFICFTLSNNNINNSTAEEEKKVYIYKNYLSNIITDIHEIQKNKKLSIQETAKANEKEETIYSNLAATTVNYMGIPSEKKRRRRMRITHTHTQHQTFERH